MPDTGLPEPPSILCDLAKQEWEERGPGLARMGILTQVDVAIYAAYCQSYADYCRAREGIRLLIEGLPKGETSRAFLTRGTLGTDIKNPLFRIARESAQDMIRFAGELGLTPAARARLEVIPLEDQKESKLKSLLYVEKKKGRGET